MHLKLARVDRPTRMGTSRFPAWDGASQGSGVFNTRFRPALCVRDPSRIVGAVYNAAPSGSTSEHDTCSEDIVRSLCDTIADRIDEYDALRYFSESQIESDSESTGGCATSESLAAELRMTDISGDSSWDGRADHGGDEGRTWYGMPLATKALWIPPGSSGP